jgi:type II secretory pathway predicted ATPase ExeA/cell division septation protein DedD
MYCKFFKFSEMPFDLTPDPKFLYLSPGHREIFDSLIYGIRERLRLIVLVGEQGVGKSTLFDAALDRFVEGIKVINIVDSDMSFERMLAMALIDLGLTKPEEPLSSAEMVDRLKTFATQQLAKEGGVVFIVKDSQNLEHRAMEDLLLLSDLESHEHKLVQIVLSGQPELETKLSQPEFRQLESRINLMLHINPLGEEETYNYVQHRLTTASYKGPALFEGGALKLIWEYSGGVPRRINTVCDNALLISYGRGKKGVEAGIVEEAIKDLNWKPFSGRFEAPIGVPISDRISQENTGRQTSDKMFHLSKIFGAAANYCNYLVEWFSGHGKRLLEKVREIVDRFILPPHLTLAGGLVAALCIIFAVWLFSGSSEVDRRAGESASGSVETEVPTTVEEISETEIPSAMEQVVENQESTEVPLVGKGEEYRRGLEILRKGEGFSVMERETPVLPRAEKVPAISTESSHVKEKPDEKKTTVSTLKPEPKSKGINAGKVILQLGAFREKRAAEGLKRRLMDKGYDAYLEKVEVKGKGRVHRVRIRCCSNLTEARAVKAQLRKQGFGKSFIVGQKKN